MNCSTCGEKVSTETCKHIRRLEREIAANPNPVAAPYQDKDVKQAREATEWDMFDQLYGNTGRSRNTSSVRLNVEEEYAGKSDARFKFLKDYIVVRQFFSLFRMNEYIKQEFPGYTMEQLKAHGYSTSIEPESLSHESRNKVDGEDFNG